MKQNAYDRYNNAMAKVILFKITSKLKKKALPVIKEKPYTYVPEQTDTQKAPKESQFSDEEATSDENFKKYMVDYYTKLRKGIDLEKAVRSRVKNDMATDKLTTKALLKRKREAPVPNEASPILRPKSRAGLNKKKLSEK
ncbi:hypothetical protein ON010_g12309 [Phytophthora cinnamomi]|nr:hypothetical protein ON010_g12309 [Phytophthora cinnamomi]